MQEYGYLEDASFLYTSNVRRFDSLGPRLNKAEIFSVDTDNDTIAVLILTVNIKGNLSS
jgi:hypothetical protein